MPPSATASSSSRGGSAISSASTASTFDDVVALAAKEEEGAEDDTANGYISRKAKIEEERNYELVTRKRRATGVFVKSFLRFLFSHVGLVLLCIVLAAGGELYVYVYGVSEPFLWLMTKEFWQRSITNKGDGSM